MARTRQTRPSLAGHLAKLRDSTARHRPSPRAVLAEPCAAAAVVAAAAVAAAVRWPLQAATVAAAADPALFIFHEDSFVWLLRPNAVTQNSPSLTKLHMLRYLRGRSSPSHLRAEAAPGNLIYGPKQPPASPKRRLTRASGSCSGHQTLAHNSCGTLGWRSIG